MKVSILWNTCKKTEQCSLSKQKRDCIQGSEGGLGKCQAKSQPWSVFCSEKRHGCEQRCQQWDRVSHVFPKPGLLSVLGFQRQQVPNIRNGDYGEVKLLKEFNLSFIYEQPTTIPNVEVNCLSLPDTQSRLPIGPMTVQNPCFGALHFRVRFQQPCSHATGI